MTSPHARDHQHQHQQRHAGPGTGAQQSRQARRRNPSAAITGDDSDYYRLLGIPYTATKAEITRAYREAIKLVHPDRQAPEHRAAAEERAKTLNRAYSTLVHPETRRTYDESIKTQAVQDQIMNQYFGGFGMPGSADPTGERLRRRPTAEEQRTKQRNERQAMISVVIVFAGATIAVFLGLVLWGAINALAGWLF